MFGEDFDHEVRTLSLGTKSHKELPQMHKTIFILPHYQTRSSLTLYLVQCIFFFEKMFLTVEPASRKFVCSQLKENKPLKSQ